MCRLILTAVDVLLALTPSRLPSTRSAGRGRPQGPIYVGFLTNKEIDHA